LYEVENDTGGIGKIGFFENPRFGRLSELDNDTGGMGELEFFINPTEGLVRLSSVRSLYLRSCRSSTTIME
jgi:hypothetical protein